MAPIAQHEKAAPSDGCVNSQVDGTRIGNVIAATNQRQIDEELPPIVAVNGDFARQVAAGDYVATIEPTRCLSERKLDILYEEALSGLGPEVGLAVTLKLFQHVRANIEYYVSHLAAKSRVIYFCTDNVEDAIRIRLCLDRLGRRQRILLLYASAPEFADLYIKYGIEPCVFDSWWIENALQNRSNSAKPLNIHLWIDVGTAREGILPTDLPTILPLLDQSGIVVEGMATHFSAVRQDHAAQKSRFDCALQMVANRGIRPRVVHAIASHNGLGYSDLTGRLSSGKINREALYNMVRPGCALGLGPRWDLDGPRGEVLRIELPVREARIAHIKDIPKGWNLGYWENKFVSPKRIAVLEGTRLNSLRYETFQAPHAHHAEPLRTVISHGSIAAIELSRGGWQVGDTLKCETTMWRSFFTRQFERHADGSCTVSIRDAQFGQISRLPIAIRALSNEHLRHKIDQSISVALNRKLESIGRRKRIGWFVKELLVRSIFSALRATNSIEPLGKRVNSLIIPVGCC